MECTSSVWIYIYNMNIYIYNIRVKFIRRSKQQLVWAVRTFSNIVSQARGYVVAYVKSGTPIQFFATVVNDDLGGYNCCIHCVAF